MREREHTRKSSVRERERERERENARNSSVLATLLKTDFPPTGRLHYQTEESVDAA